MKNILAILLFTFTSNLFFGQNVFDKFEEVDEITSVIVSKKMFEMMGSIKTNDKEGQEFLKLVQTLDNLKVFSTSNAKHRAEIKSTFEKYLEVKKLEQLMSIYESGTNVKIYVNQGKNTTQIKELLMLVEENKLYQNETAIILLTGNFDLNDISSLVDKMNIPGGEELKKASKKK